MSMCHFRVTNLRAIARAALLAVSCAAMLAPTGAAAQQMSDVAAAQISALLAEKETRNAAQRKIDSQLLYASRMARGLDAAPGVPTLEVDIPVDHKGMVEIDIRAKVGGKVEQLVRDAGGYVVRTFDFGDSIEARVPLDALETIAGSELVRFIAPKAEGMLQSAGRPTGVGPTMEPAAMTPRLTRFKETVKRAVDAANLRAKNTGGVVINAGTVTSEGDATHRANNVRTTLGNNGAGICIGVLSDSYNARAGNPAATDVANGDLPGLGTPFPFSQPVGFAGSGDSPSGGDEGRAMLQIVHDLAPGARLYFATAFNGLLDFANNIRALRGIAAAPGGFGNVFPKCDIIVDDVFYFVESGLHDGQPAPSNFNIAQIAQAVNDVVADGAMYFSSAGNSGNTTQVRPSIADNTAGAWEGDYVGAPAPAPLAAYADALVWSGADVGNTLQATGNTIVLQWSDPVGASANDYDLCRLDATLTVVSSCSTNIQNGTQDPVELVSTGSANQRLVVVRKAGAALRFMSLTTNRGRLQYATTGQTRGHSAALLGMGVAATPAATAFNSADTPTPNGPFPNPFIGTNQIEYFSSDGPRRSFFNMDGTAITPGNFLAGTGGGVVRMKPDMTAADGVVTTLPGGSGLNPFYGTSAAAPHAGAIAALIKQGLPNAAPLTITNIMKNTALDIMAPGPDKDSGAGIVQAFQAVQGSGGALGAIVRPTAVNVIPFGSNAIVEPNECNTFNVPLINEGTAGATAISSTITTSTPGVALTKPTATYANLASNGGTGSNATPFEVSVAKAVACLSTATFTQTVQYAGGAAPRSFTFTLPIGQPAQYTFAAQASVGLPGGATGPVTGSAADDAVVDIAVPAGFNFNVYGTAVTGGSIIKASTNGNLQIQATGGSNEWGNTALPAGAFSANPVLMPLWDDLILTTAGGGIYTNLVGVAPNRQFVVEWRGKRFDDTGTAQTLNFGVLFNENSSTIEFRYPQTNNPVLPSGSGATVGVQSGASNAQFTQFSFNQPNVPTGTVIRGTLSAPCAPAATGQCSTPLFVDVPNGYWSAREINTVYNTFPRVSQGCLANPLSFCPTDQVTREQMAAFIVRAKEGEPSPTLCAGAPPPFADVSTSSLFCPYITRLKALGITAGCGNGNYCPTALVTRQETVTLLVRAVEGDPSPTLCAGGSPFTDVPQASLFCPYILRARDLGITSGCTPTTFCPLDNALRSEMAVFIVRAFGL